MTVETIRFEGVPVEGETRQFGIIRIAREQVLNAIDGRVLEELDQAVARLEQTPEIGAVILTGAGPRAFVAGGDLREMATFDCERARQFALTGQALLRRIEALPIPVIGALNGFTLGGGLELALGCDFLVASESCRWGLPEVSLGVLQGFGATQRLPRLVGPMLARRIALSGEIFTARQGYEWGLFAEVLPAEHLESRARELAATLVSRSPTSVAWVKEAIRASGERPFREGELLEAELFARCFGTEDFQSRVRAFLERRSGFCP